MAEYTGLEIAVIGIAGRFPGAYDVNEFWKLLKEGREGVSHFTDEELLEAGIDPEIVKDPLYIKSRGIIEDEDKFDPTFFDLFPREAEIMDPQHRLFLETCWHALEDSGYNPFKYPGLIGLFGGVSMNTYLYHILTARKGQIGTSEGYQLSIGNDKDFLTTRAAYKLNLKGPSVTVQTACSTSLVAVHMACQNLQSFNCDMALAGGVSITIPQKQGYFYQEGMILSKDGHCRPFDHRASGTISGAGSGIVVLKRLSDALEDNDHIYAVVKGSAYNNDGNLRIGYTAPSVEGQADVIQTAQSIADINPESISYIETHGTGTELGDPIEIKALTEVFSEQTDKKQFCAIGSVKSNIGHLDAAAGVAGFIKTVLALKNKQIPPSLHYEKANPKIDFDTTPFFVNNELKKWETNGQSRLAGISSFGIGGTNAHVILQEAPEFKSDQSANKSQLIAFSAKESEPLENLSEKLAEFCSENSNESLANISYTLLQGRTAFEKRRFTVAENTSDLKEILETKNPKRLFSYNLAKDNQVAVFMFSGQGSQYINMARNIYENTPVFKMYFDQCCELTLKFTDINLKHLIYPVDYSEEAEKKLSQTIITQPALFAIEYALAQLLINWGIKPAAMVGHSIGEYVAACIAGVMSLENTIKIVCERGRLMQSMPSGDMISIALDEQAVQKYLSDDVSVATINGPAVTVLSGTHDAVTELEAKLKNDKIEFRKLHTSHAFHSSMMEPILAEFQNFVSQFELKKPQIPYLSNVSGTWIKQDDAVDPAYYAKHLRNAVRFGDNLNELLEDESTVLIEIGPGKALTSLATKHPAYSMGRMLIQTIRHPQEKENDYNFLLNTLGKLWLSGIETDWDIFFENQKYRRIPLPGYPFQRKRFWYKDIKTGTAKFEETEGKVKDINKWFYYPSWVRTDRPEESNEKDYSILITGSSDSPLVSDLISALKERKHKISTVINSKDYSGNDSTFYAQVSDPEHWKTIFEHLKNDNNLPDYIINTLPLEIPEVDDFKLQQESGYFTLVAIGKALQSIHSDKKIILQQCISEVFDVIGSEKIISSKATVLGPARVLPQEINNLTIKICDYDKKTIEPGLIIKELFSDGQEHTIVYRSGHRWNSIYKQAFVNTGKRKTVFKNKGTYLITGGLGRIGLVFAHYLAKNYNANLILINTTTVPDEKKWPEILRGERKDLTYFRVLQLEKIKKSAGSLSIEKADIADVRSIQEIVDNYLQTVKRIDGVIHAAGTLGESMVRLLNEITPSDFDNQFHGKGNGVKTLAEVFRNIETDFVILQSSLSTVLGGLGFTAYSAVNHFLDSFINSIDNTKTRWISINWDGWRFDSQASQSLSIDDYSIVPEEGNEAFEKIIESLSHKNIIVSTGNLSNRIERWLINPQLELVSESQDTADHERPELMTAYVEPKSKFELDVAAVWQKLLGIKKIGIHDNFFDLGGNSLLGTQLVAQLRQKFKVELPLRALFEDATISGVVKLIEDGSKEEQEDISKMTDILGQLENMSEEQAAELLKKRKQ